jgi:aspartate/glutamate racemase
VPKRSQQLFVEGQIRNVIAGQARPSSELTPLICSLGDAGAEAILLGCTELSVLFDGANVNTLVDPLDIVVAGLLPDK